MRKPLVRSSKFLSLVLRHDPARIGLTLDQQGWASIDELLSLAEAAGHSLSPEQLEEVVLTNEKRRFAISDDGTRIRARQGHSVEVDLGLEPVEPPERLFHGTAERNLDSIRELGLEPRARQHVHLSAEQETARQVGGRHGRPVVLIVRARELHADGTAFSLSENGVWLVAAVPPTHLEAHPSD